MQRASVSPTILLTLLAGVLTWWMLRHQLSADAGLPQERWPPCLMQASPRSLIITRPG